MPQIIQIKVLPRANQNKIMGYNAGVLRVHIAAVPVDGKANQELIKFLSKEFGIRKSDIKIVKGHASREKILEIPDNVIALQNRLI